MIPAEQLVIEHHLIERVVDKLDRHIGAINDATQIDISLIKQGIEFLEQYADYCHQGKEEDSLFKSLEGEELTAKHRQILKGLIEEHRMVRAAVRDLAFFTGKASQGDKAAYQDIAELIKKIASFYRLHFEKGHKRPLHEYYLLLAESWEKTPGTVGNSPAQGKQKLVKKYQNQDIIIYWYPQQCSHAGKCWGELPMVFKPQERPWIDLAASSSEEVIRTIDKCPSRALKYELPPGSSVDPALARGPGSVHYKIEQSAAIKIRMIKDGPLLIEGAARVFDADNRLLKEADRFVLCRCGKTNNPPYCDGRHIHKEGV